MRSIESAAGFPAPRAERKFPVDPVRFVRPAVFALVIAAHAAVILMVAFTTTGARADDEPLTVMKMVDVDVREREKPVAPPAPPDEVVTSVAQPKIAEETIVSEVPLEMVETPAVSVEASWDAYVPMHKISKVPVMPESAIRNRVKYPELALRAGIEGLVFLELYIDEQGRIRRVVVLKEDPAGKGFAAAAIRALDGMTCAPAEANGKVVAVKYRYPLRFTVK